MNLMIFLLILPGEKLMSDGGNNKKFNTYLIAQLNVHLESVVVDHT